MKKKWKKIIDGKEVGKDCLRKDCGKDVTEKK